MVSRSLRPRGEVARLSAVTAVVVMTSVALASALPLTGAAAGVSASAAAAGPTSTLPGGLSTAVLVVTDPSRPTPAAPGVARAASRSIRVVVTLPADPAPAPLVVVAPSMTDGPLEGEVLWRAMARKGVAVAVVQGPLAGRRAVPGPLLLRDRGNQPGDVSVALSHLLAPTARSPAASTPTASPCSAGRRVARVRSSSSVRTAAPTRG